MTQAPTIEQFLAMRDNEDDVELEYGHADPLTSIAESLRTIAAGMSGEALPAAQVDSESESETVRSLSEELDDLKAKHRALFGLLADVEKLIKPSTSKLALGIGAAIDAWKNPEIPDQVEETPAAETAVDWNLLCRNCASGDDVAVPEVHTSGRKWLCVACGADGRATEGLPYRRAAAQEAQPAQTVGGFVGRPTRDADVEQWRSYARSAGYTGDVDSMNRSQIRTVLGIDHGAGEGSS